MRYVRGLVRTIAGIIVSLLSNRGLVKQMAVREIVAKYKGSYLGVLWNVLTPVMMLSVYTLVFGTIFKSRWVGGSGSTAEFAIMMFAGLIIFNFFSEVVNRAPNLILDNPNYVKKVVFPLEALTWVSLMSALTSVSVNLLVLFVFHVALLNSMVPWTFLLIPFLLLPLIILVVGVSWFLASLGVFMRDVSPVIGVLVSALMFLSPIFYPSDILPQNLQVLVQFNPLAYYIESARDILIWGRLDKLSLYPFQLGISLVVATCGLGWFRRTRHAFADVM